MMDSDHLIIYGVYRESAEEVKQCIKKVRCFKNCDTENLISNLQEAPWHVMGILDNIDEMWDYWKSLYLSVINNHAPLRKVRVRQKSIPWMTEEVRRLARARNYFRKKFRRTKDPKDWEYFRRLRNLVTKKLKGAQCNHFENLSSTNHPRKMWR